jgi:hypothetical protein
MLYILGPMTKPLKGSQQLQEMSQNAPQLPDPQKRDEQPLATSEHNEKWLPCAINLSAS